MARECKPQEMANTLWAYATMERRPGERVLWVLDARRQTGQEALQGQRLVI